MSDIIISASNLTKTYRAYAHPLDRLLGGILPGRAKRCKEFHALNDVSFDIKRGETIGIIGRNGSGKSTLLQLICGIRKPTSGSLQVNGRISALLELGAGFHPEFTGRENVFLQGSIQGMSRQEMEARFDDIAAFADIGEYIDQPVKTYSSGMFVRLAFAVAVSVEPDILVVDEALAVGDLGFQQKCFKRIRDLKDQGTTLFLVSHDRGAILTTCERALLLSGGEVVMDSSPAAVFDYYSATLSLNTSSVNATSRNGGYQLERTGSGEATVVRIQMIDKNNKSTSCVEVGDKVKLEVTVQVKLDIPRLVLGFSIRDRLGVNVYGANTHYLGQPIHYAKSGDVYVFSFTLPMDIGVGTYSVSTALVSTDSCHVDNYESWDIALVFGVTNSKLPTFAGYAWLNAELSVTKI